MLGKEFVHSGKQLAVTAEGGNGADKLDGGPGFHDYCVAGPGGLATVNCE